MRILALGILFMAIGVRGQENFRLSYVADKLDEYCRLRGPVSTQDTSASRVTIPRVRGPRGPRGPSGQNGPQGPPGLRGLPGPTEAVDYDRLRQLVNEAVEDKFNVLQKEISAPRNSTTKTFDQHLCGVLHDGRCYWANTTSGVTVIPARTICENYGAHAANIYSAEHFELISQYLARVATDGHDYVTGMNYDESAGVITLRDGTQAPYVRWYSNAPYSSRGPVIVFDSNSLIAKAGYWNEAKDNSQEGVLCEKII